MLQGVSRHETGHYSCGAENTEGAGPHSKPIYLDVLCKFKIIQAGPNLEKWTGPGARFRGAPSPLL